jgi:hypothetical protein
MAKSYRPEELAARYGKSEKGNFYVKDTIGVPHPYMITPGHVSEAARHHGGMLGETAIESAERKRIFCGICKGLLKFHEHETGLLIACKVDLNKEGKIHPELNTYLKSIVDKCEEDGYAGFSFLDER